MVFSFSHSKEEYIKKMMHALSISEDEAKKLYDDLEEQNVISEKFFKLLDNKKFSEALKNSLKNSLSQLSEAAAKVAIPLKELSQKSTKELYKVANNGYSELKKSMQINDMILGGTAEVAAFAVVKILLAMSVSLSLPIVAAAIIIPGVTVAYLPKIKTLYKISGLLRVAEEYTTALDFAVNLIRKSIT